MAPSLGWRHRAPAATAAVALLLLAALAGVPAARAARRETKGVKITVQAKWQATPLLHEAAEFLADEVPALFWRFVEEWQRGSEALGGAPSPQQCWAGIRQAAAAHLSPNMARLFSAALAARQYSPRLEMFRQLAWESVAAAPACCWALLGGAAYTEAAPLEAALAAALQAKAAALREGAGRGVEGGAGAVYPFDHIYAAAASSAPPLNITAPATVPVELFAPIGSRCGAQLHAVLAAAAERADAAAAAAAAPAAAPRLAYAWRPLLDAAACSAAGEGVVHPCTALGTEGRLVVPGYGVELALKNMEYNAQDDSKKVNNLEQDRQYQRWPRELQTLLMPMYPGRLPTVARNVLNAVYAFDPASPAALDIGALLHQLQQQAWPLRTGLLPVVAARVARARGGAGPRPDDAPSLSERMGRLLGAVHAAFGGRAAVHFLYAVRQAMPAQADGQADFDDRLWLEAVRAAEEQWAGWGELAEVEEGPVATAAEAVVMAERAGEAGSKEVAARLQAAAELAHSTGLAGPARSGVLVFNGVVSTNDGGSGWHGVTMGAVQSQLQQVQEDVYMQRLTDAAVDIYEEEYQARQLALAGPLLGLNATSPPAAGGGGGGLWIRYFGPQPSLAAEEEEASGPAPLAAVTHWVAADAGSRQGLRLVAAGLQHRSSNGRLGVVVNSGAGTAAPGADAAAQLLPVEKVVVAVGSGLLETDLNDFVDGLDAVVQQPQAPAALTLAQLDELLQARRRGGFEGRLEPALSGLGASLGQAAASQAGFVRRALGLGAGANAVVSNGRVVELPAEPPSGGDDAAGSGAEFEPHDFELLELYAQRNQYSERMAELVRSASQFGALRGVDLSAAAAVVSSALAAAKPEEVDARSGRVSELISGRSVQKNFVRVAAAGPADSAPLLVQAVVNPLSKPAQRLAPLLAFLRGVLDVDREYHDMPLKTFYRYALPTLGSPDGGPPAPAAATFTRLPPNKVLTLGMDEPEPWLVEPVQAEADLDNLRLEELGPGVAAAEAVFELEALMLTGMCLDLASLAARMREQIHPRGVQLQLQALSAPEAAPPLVDTLVMSNLGYFQLKAGPGLWKLKLAPGRSQELYSVASSTGASSSGQRAEAAVAGADAHQVPVAMSSFGGKHMHLFLRKHADRLSEDVLEAEEGEPGKGSLWSKVTSWAGSGGGGVPAPEGEGERETIHVFTVASGHMYERLQKIMILSVIKRTPARVKFWFIKNYMSPQMKAFVPFMAEKYDFDYEFVTYKWPSWLHKQTEKQRIIWAYKILFLDVLFPLGLKKVIFCDSDQVVRADLRELWHMDLQGAPYGYTPFCDNNKEMEGFRFWKQGFWREHLQGRPYHISALYVIDLERFRQMAAGDRLRVIYDGLSKDPNSLANLDQDLPNYAQHGVPIFSLPSEWLWCET
ncbi:hypothetical protein CHLNCDRAFT_59065 [Chlorella variabilis]|uniref:UDP-glucose:glycoprotein glucosyltransferase n=1 Tax=Chlorella variabilis TaxID=554065 RepID=E1ZQD0_CHLVA|nr:hypothetical protein CHLNCDRAFT_59065 [Chlorella variabilis]EFN52002.1 hypothetical protein CHLNCDRAFT_59065 [Chlorella variabilis]|eukprot:XP_005844104.1 hypothetical protein CHLNCDRAFT_59065 [Chlorella variabilis]